MPSNVSPLFIITEHKAIERLVFRRLLSCCKRDWKFYYGRQVASAVFGWNILVLIESAEI